MAGATKYVYFFGNGKAEGKGTQKTLLGGKGAGLAEMTNIGLPVPGGFTITTEACQKYYDAGKRWPRGLEGQVRQNVAKLEKACRKKLGDPRDPLLVSVRSGAALSMPGMMETILNLGLNDQSVEGLAQASQNRRFALDAYRRFIMMFGATAKGVERARFDAAFEDVKEHKTRPRTLDTPPRAEPAAASRPSAGGGGGVSRAKILDTDVTEEELGLVIERFKAIYSDYAGQPFPQDPYTQLVDSINAVFGSWMAEKAVTYRRVEKISGLGGTAVNICQMVFGNMGDDSGTGVCFTRDPSTGENTFYGDLLINAQGEDVVAGVRTPIKLGELERLMPAAYEQLEAVRAMLELHYQEMQDLEFTIERGKLYMLQCRTGKRSPAAAFKIAVDQATQPLMTVAQASSLVKRKLLPARYAQAAAKPVITKEQAIARIKPVDMERLFYPVIDPAISGGDLQSRRIGAGINAVPGAASGQVVFTAHDAEARAANGQRVILVRKETSPEDVGGMHAAAGILTATGGKTSHAAVVARGWGKCCIVGADALAIDYAGKSLSFDGRMVREGESITLDGSAGVVYQGELPLVRPEPPKEFETLMGWVDQRRRLRVRTNADTPADAAKAIEMGAEGIGLCRTEHMFFETEERRLAMQEMIVAEGQDARRAALDKLLPFQRKDFIGIFEAMRGLPVTIRLIDPPLHEFLPQDEEGVRKLSEYSGKSADRIRYRTQQLHEANPMLGHRGCRLCVTYPEILEMQVKAIIEAAVDCTRRGIKTIPEIMIPLSIDRKELAMLVDQTRAVADEIIKREKVRLSYLVGTMIETPRAALLADQLADVCEFFSFGTNDLTQTVMALSRDDAGRFLPDYLNQERAAIFKEDPFQTLDQEGVGMLVEWGIAKGRTAHPKLKIGICGEHGGEAESVKFCHKAGMDYVSCSPFRVPIARLAAAQAAMSDRPARAVTRRGKKAVANRSARSRKAKNVRR